MSDLSQQLGDAHGPEWHGRRGTCLGGSDAATVANVNPWKTRLRLAREKRGELEREPAGEAALWGTRLEPVIRQVYADATGRSLRAIGTFYRHQQHPEIGGYLDGIWQDLGSGAEGLYEGKTARSSEGWGESGTDQVPIAYYYQVQHYMMVTGLQSADIAVLFGGQRFEIYAVPGDTEFQAMLLDAEVEFWARYVVGGEDPEPESPEDVKLRWQWSRPTSSVYASDATLDNVQMLARVKSQLSLLEQRRDELQVEIQKAMQDSEQLLGDRNAVLATWRSVNVGDRFDADAFQRSHPDLYTQFVRPGKPQRRFLLKVSEEVEREPTAA